MSEAWRELVDLQRLARWMDAQTLAPGVAIEQPTLLTGGTQNLLLRFTRGGRGFVLRRPPKSPRVDGSETMRREARVLAALAKSTVPHAHLIAACTEPEVLGAAFYLMEPVQGYAPTAGLPPQVAAQPLWCRRLGLSLAEAIADLGALDPQALGLGDFSRTEGWLQRQAPRWHQQLQAYAEFAGWPGVAALPGVDEVAQWLQAHTPALCRIGIVHGDYHFGNVMFRHDAPELAAIVDWELASLGDPLLDLGWLIATWPDAQGHSVVKQLEVRPWAGFPQAAELANAYAARSGRDLSDLRWYTVLACYKLGIILEGTHARAHAGKAPMPMGLELHAAAGRLIERALGMMGSAA
jgi:aminoglycoside phosphotransferase (APT) family kinase protein